MHVVLYQIVRIPILTYNFKISFNFFTGIEGKFSLVYELKNVIEMLK